MSSSLPTTGRSPVHSERRRPLPGRLAYTMCFGVAAIWLLLDQASKALAVMSLPDHGPAGIDLGVVTLRLVRNENAAFGIPGFTGMFVLVTVLVVALVVRALRRADRLSLAAAYGLVAGGALGNAGDRLFRQPGFPDGGVVDFVDLGWWPVFNVADVGIVVGAIAIVVLLAAIDREEREEDARRKQHQSVRPATTAPRGGDDSSGPDDGSDSHDATAAADDGDGTTADGDGADGATADEVAAGGVDDADQPVTSRS